jgi:ABC-type transporter MlaC component
MGIKTFVLSLLFLSIGLLIATITFTPTKQSTKNKIMPTVTFIDSIMYDINNNEVTQLIKSKKAYHYKTKDELYNATIILKTKNDKNNKLISDTISAKFIEITKNNIKFRGDVNYNRSTGTALQSQALDYDRIAKHLTGNKKFIAFYNGNKLKGNSLLISKEKTIFKSNDNTPVKLDIIMDKKRKK